MLKLPHSLFPYIFDFCSDALFGQAEAETSDYVSVRRVGPKTAQYIFRLVQGSRCLRLQPALVVWWPWVELTRDSGVQRPLEETELKNLLYTPTTS